MLPPETEKLWNFLSTQSALGGFVLIGGSALALRIQHRLSEDLDFAFHGQQLPRGSLAALTPSASAQGFTFTRDDDAAALQEFSSGGLELHDYQQDFLVNGLVKVSFFAPDAPVLRSLAPPDPTKPRLATLQELFKTKCLVSALRSKSRDWLDLFLLLRDHGFTMRDYAEAFRAAGADGQRDLSWQRLCSGAPQRGDEGFAHLLKNAPTVEEMKQFFIAQRDLLEVAEAEEAHRKNQAQ